jgi:hypothetical protein
MRAIEKLHLCGSCRHPFVVPEAILEVLGQGEQYVVELRCGDCGWAHVGAYPAAALEELDRELDRAQAEIEAALEVCELIEELERIDRFVEALNAGLILPEDF